MPFTYFGTKASLAKHYRPPAHRTIIEPFAGAAGYSVHFATPQHRVILVERDENLVKLWRRLQADTAADDLMSIQCPPLGAMCTEPLIGGSDLAFFRAMRGLEFQITTRMVDAWPVARLKILRALPVIKGFEIIEGDYTDAPDIAATWFIDPPYWKPPDSLVDARGGKYTHGADDIDYTALGAWCEARRGQVIVCEQEGATWLPFRPFRAAPTLNTKQRRMEVIWERAPGSMIATTRSAQLAADAKARKKERRG